MSQIAELCEQIIAHLTAIGSPIANFLQPGLSEAEIREVEARLLFVFPDSLVEMYKWHNGIELVTGTTFFPWWCVDNIKESFGRYEILTAPKNGIWEDNWFPVFSSSDISSIGISCKQAPSADGEIPCFEYTAQTQIEFSSLDAMLRTILAAYETKVIFMGSDAELDYDEAAFARIARQFNPGIKRWQG